MNPESASIPPPPLPPLSVKPQKLELSPMDASPGFGNAIDALLKQPGKAIYELSQGKYGAKLSFCLLLLSILGMVAFGLVVGSFSGEIQLWASPVKLASGLLAASLLSLPSLYIFCCLAGLDVKFTSLCGILWGATGLSSLLLAGFAPIAWVFSQSTSSLAFMGVMLIIMWIIAFYMGMSFLLKAARALGMTEGISLHLWVILYAIVCLQMSCALRPILGKSDSLLPTEKRFFLEHWGTQLNGGAR